MLDEEMEETILDILNEQYNKYRSRTQSQMEQTGGGNDDANEEQSWRGEQDE